MDHKKLLALVAIAATATAMGITGTASAAQTSSTTVFVAQNHVVKGPAAVIKPGDTHWYVETRKSGGDVAFVDSYGAPEGLGQSSLQLSTDESADKVKPMNHQFAGTPLGEITTLGYQTYQAPGNWEGADAAFQLQIDLDGDVSDPSDQTTLVYEPYQQGTVVPAVWQSWDVAAGTFWSTRSTSLEGGAPALKAGHGGSFFYTIADVLAFHPSAAVLGIGVNIGGNNANFTVAVDGITFGTAAAGTTVFDFTDMNDCKAAGWGTNFPNAQFNNRGSCVSSLTTSEHSAR